MQYHNSFQISRPVFHPGAVRRLAARRERELPGGGLLWMASAKAAVLVAGVALLMSLLIGFGVSRVHDDMRAINERQHALKDEQIALLAERASLMSKQQISRRVATQLALYEAEQDQVFKVR